MKEYMIITEEKSNQNIITKYSLDKKLINITDSKETRKQRTFAYKISNWLKDVFLPQGYPNSVTPDYWQFQLWDTLQAYSSFISNTLTLHTVLKGLGVGNESASSTAAVLTWLIKDGVGMVSSIGFAYCTASALDSNGKQWRLFADVVNDLTFLVKLCSSFLPIPFWITLSLSSILVSLVGVAGSATRASVVQHLAKRDNMADLAAKEGSQETVVNLLGLLTSLTIVPLVAKSLPLTWIIFVMSVAFHLFCNYKAMKSLRMTSLNRLRLVYILRQWMTNRVMPTVEEANIQEPLLFGPAFNSDYLTSSVKLSIGGSLQDVQRHCSNPEEYLYHNNLDNEKYLLFANDKENRMYLVLTKDATSKDTLTGFMASYLYAVNRYENGILLQEFSIDKNVSKQQLFKFSNEVAQRSIAKLTKELKSKGWSTDCLKVNSAEWRIEIGKKSK